MNRQGKIVSQLTDRELLFNLYLTQAILFVIAMIGSYFVFSSLADLLSLFQANMSDIFLIGGSVALIVIIIDFILYKYVPKHLIDDGGVNQRVFSRRSVWHIILLCVVIAFVEELLFRGVIQTAIGLVYASFIFAVIHVRYLKSIVLFTVVVLVSFILGWLFFITNNLLVPMFAHFIIDCVLGIAIMVKYRKKLDTCDSIKR